MKPDPHKRCRVLVTGAGSGVGQGIIKALRLSKLPLTIIGADIAPMNAALYRTDEAVIVPRVELPGSLAEIVKILLLNRVDVVMVGSEFDLVFFSENRAEIEGQAATLVIASPPNTVHVADDKWLTAEFLRENDLPYAEAALPTGLDDAARIAGEWGYPVVLKTRRGTSSRHVHIVKDRRMMADCYPSTPLPMLQRLLAIPGPELHREYTCSVFKTPDGQIFGPFTARRTIRGGTSWHVEVARFPELHELLLGIGRAMDFMGSLNVQLMLTENGPVPFELNARFSGTTAVRAHFGFNEPEMVLRAYFYKEAIPAPVIRSGIAMRYHEEVFIDDVAADQLSPATHKGYVNTWF
jgi:carbamoyl-phosphate synthase large subunit